MMKPEDYFIQRHNPKLDLGVLAYFSGAQKTWPPYIEFSGDIFKFTSNEAMSGWMVGGYSGHAKYVYCPEGRHIEPKKPEGLVVKNNIQKYEKEYLERCIAVVEATAFEVQSLWEKYNSHSGSNRSEGTVVKWETDNSGYGLTIGYLAGLPINISFSRVKIDGENIVFWHPTSQIVDYRLCEEYMKGATPNAVDIATGRHIMVDASNFHAAVQRAHEAKRAHGY